MLAEGIGARTEAVLEALGELWHFEIASVQDTTITLGKLVLALVLILAGLFVSKLLSRQLGRRVLPRFGLNPGAAHALQALSFYGLLLLFALYALHIVGIPLTVFTLAGGALAIGLGLGSQNLVNNFLSGLILLTERPIRIGDLVDVDGTYGTVERIGARSTRIRSGENTHIVVPNSAFLENKVLNWTLSDRVVRTHVDVGVSYGSPTREVTRLLQRALDDHGQVLTEPAPLVLFIDFGDSSLQFRAYFWVRVQRVLDRLRVCSDIRHRIAALFREAGITIAFPQRDVHLDGLAPLEVRMLGSEERTGAADGGRS